MADSTKPPDPADSSAEEPLDLVVRLVGSLDEAGVTYCHWKSNEAMARTMSAENDLDLLVDRRHGPLFNATLAAFGFKNAQTSASRHVPGMVDHYCLDVPSGRMVHVQAHYQLVLGDDMTKNFRLPIEQEYLASSSAAGPIPVPEPAFEFLVFILRMVVKHCPLDAQASRKGRLGISERRELVYLNERVDPVRVEALRAQHTPMVSAELLADCLAAIAPDASRATRARAGRALIGVLEPVSRDSRASDLRLRVYRRFRRSREDGRPASRRKLDTGGLFVSIVGGDGSGKSSAVAALNATFGRHFPTHVFHLGKPSRSVRTRVVAKARRWWRKLARSKPANVQPWTDWDTAEYPGFGFVIGHTLTARDRHRTFDRARREAARGAIVITDRFPLDDIRMMDSARCAQLPGIERRRIAGWLARKEASYYEKITAPDLLVVLRVDPQLAVRRRSEQDEEFVRRRAQEVWDLEWSALDATVVDASQPHEDVLRQVHAAVWDAL